MAKNEYSNVPLEQWANERYHRCAKMIRRSRFWLMVAIFSSLHTWVFATVNTIFTRTGPNGKTEQVLLYYLYILATITLLLALRIEGLPIQLRSLLALKKYHLVGLGVIISTYILTALLAKVSITLLVSLLFLFYFFLPLILFIVAHQYLKISKPFAAILGLQEIQRWQDSGGKQQITSHKRLSLYLDLLLGSAEESTLKTFVPAYKTIQGMKDAQTVSAESLQSLKEFFEVVSSTANRKKVQTIDEDEKDKLFCLRFDARNIMLSAVIHWLHPYLHSRKQYLGYLTNLGEVTNQTLDSSPKNQFESKLLHDFDIYDAWEKQQTGEQLSFILLIIVAYGLWYAFYHTNVFFGQLFAAAATQYPSLISPQTQPPVIFHALIQNNSLQAINSYFFLIFFVPCVIWQLATIKFIDRYIVSRSRWVVGIDSRIYLTSLFLTLYIPLWRILASRPTFYVESILYLVLFVIGVVITIRNVRTSFSMATSTIQISDSIVVVTLRELYNALEEQHTVARAKKINRAVSRCKHFLRMLKIKKRTSDATANQVQGKFFDAVSNMLSLVVAHNALPAEQDELKQDIHRMIYACVMRNYRDIARDLPNSFQEAMELVNTRQESRGWIVQMIVRFVLRIAIPVGIAMLLRTFAPGLIEHIGVIADIRKLLGW